MDHQRQAVYVFAPANSMRDIPGRAIDIGIKNLNHLGFNVLFGKNVNKQHYYTAGTLEERLDDIYSGLENNAVSMMLSVYGGYNTNQLIENLDYDLIKKTNKIFVGYSDVTVLLNAIWAKSAVKSIHGPSFASFCDPHLSDEVASSFVRLVKREMGIEYTCPSFAAADFWYLKKELGPREYFPHPSWVALREGTVNGALVGGNLDSLTSLVGTAYLPALGGCILLLESSVNEAPGRFDRHMMYLRHTGIFNQIAGLIIGQFSPGSLLARTDVIKDIVDRAIFPHSFPVMINGSFSHVDPLLPLPIGGNIQLDAYTDHCKITIMDTL